MNHYTILYLLEPTETTDSLNLCSTAVVAGAGVGAFFFSSGGGEAALLFSGATLILDPLPAEGDERPTSGAIAVGLALGELTLGVLTPDGATGSGLDSGAGASGPIDGLLGGIAVEGDAFAFGNSGPVDLTSEAAGAGVDAGLAVSTLFNELAALYFSPATFV